MQSNLILPAGDVRIGPMDYNIYTNAQVPNAKALNDIPLKTEGEKSVFISDVGKAVDGSALAIQHRARERAAIGLRAHPEARRRHKHDRGGRWNRERDQDSARHSRAAEDARRLRSVVVREAGHLTVLREGGVGLVAHRRS